MNEDLGEEDSWPANRWGTVSEAGTSLAHLRKARLVGQRGRRESEI